MSRSLGVVLLAVITLTAALFLWMRGDGRPATDPVLGPSAKTDEAAQPLRELAGDAPREALDEDQAEAGPAAAQSAGDEEEEPEVAGRFQFHVRVVDGGSLEPLADVAVHTFDRGQRSQAPVFQTDADGVFVVEAGEYRNTRHVLRLEHPGYGWTTLMAQRGHEQISSAKQVSLWPVAELRVFVLENDVLAADLEVVASTRSHGIKQSGAPTYELPAEFTWRAVTDGNGVAPLLALPSYLPLTIEVREDDRVRGRLTDPVTLEPGETRELRMSLGTGATIRGLASLPDGTPVEGLDVWLVPTAEPKQGKLLRSHDGKKAVAMTRTDVDGAFRFEDVGEGNWYAGLAPQATQDGPVAPVAAWVEVLTGDRFKDARLEVHTGLYLAGRVEDSAGEVVQGVQVSVKETGYGQTVKDGTFRVGPFAPGEYELFAYAGGNRGLSSSDVVRASAGSEDLVLKIRGAASVSGLCVGSDGAPRPARVVLFPADRQAARFWSRPSAFREDGTFEVTRLVPGIYHVVATDEFGNVGVVQNLELLEGEDTTDVRVPLNPAATLLIAVLQGEDEQEDAGHAHGGGIWPIVLRDGAEIHVGGGRVLVPPGPITIDLREYDPALGELVTLDTRTVNALEGEETEVVFE